MSPFVKIRGTFWSVPLVCPPCASPTLCQLLELLKGLVNRDCGSSSLLFSKWPGAPRVLALLSHLSEEAPRLREVV